MSTQYIPQFVMKPQQFALHNSSPEAIDCTWAGLRFTIPTVDGIGAKPAAYDDGSPIPGTYVLSDTYTTDLTGVVPVGGAYNWLASEAIRNVLGIDPNTGEAISPSAKKGISFLPSNPTKEIVANQVFAILDTNAQDALAATLVPRSATRPTV